VTKETTLGILERIVEGKAEFVEWFGGLKIMNIPGFEVKTSEYEYRELLKTSMEKRIEFIQSKDIENNGYDKLPVECVERLQGILDAAIIIRSPWNVQRISGNTSQP